MAHGPHAENELEHKYELERAKWDKLSARQLGPGDVLPADLDLLDSMRRDNDMSYVAERVNDFVGDLKGKRVLELGCGRGVYAVILAHCGADVTAVDLSPGAIETTKARAELNNVSIEGIVAPAEDLPLPDETFDLAFGTASLHHLEADKAGPELWRVLKPGGRAMFLEPMGMNPVLRFTRDHIWYPYKTPRGEDRPVNYEDIEAWGKGFSDYAVEEVQLFSMAERGFGFDRRFPRLRRLDAALLQRSKLLRRWARLVAIFGIK